MWRDVGWKVWRREVWRDGTMEGGMKGREGCMEGGRYIKRRKVWKDETMGGGRCEGGSIYRRMRDETVEGGKCGGRDVWKDAPAVPFIYREHYCILHCMCI